MAKLSDFCRHCRSKDRKLMLAVSSVLFAGITVIAYLFVNSAKEYFGFDVSAGLHIGLSLLAGFIMFLIAMPDRLFSRTVQADALEGSLSFRRPSGTGPCAVFSREACFDQASCSAVPGIHGSGKRTGSPTR